MSRSRSSTPVLLRDAAMVVLRPLSTGLASIASVQIAATAIAPAPMNRTCVRHTVVACVARSTPAAAGCIAVRIGTAPTQAMTSPASIANPTDRPTRWPAPHSASE